MRACRLPVCPGMEELKPLVRTARHKGQLLVFRNVPACGVWDSGGPLSKRCAAAGSSTWAAQVPS